MSLALIFAVGGLAAIGTYLVTARSLSRIVLGLLAARPCRRARAAGRGRSGRRAAARRSRARAATAANPLPQALSLTAIVISFGLTLFLLALARRQHVLTGDDLVEDDLEDRRIAHRDQPTHADETDEGAVA